MVINFEQHPEYKGCFNTLDPQKIVAALELVSGATIEPGKSVVFLDEIQECPRAILALRYFKEQMPQLHIIGAGSLLEFVLNDADFQMPVGRVQFLYMRPVSFSEFLLASGHEKLHQFLKTVNLENLIPSAVHEKLMEILREYVALGGMPAVIAAYLETKSLRSCQEIQSSILMMFRNDFGKYVSLAQHENLRLIFSKAPGLIGQWFKYSKLELDTPIRTLKNSLSKLSDAGLIILVHATSAAGLPFITHMNEKKFKLLFLDIGLVKRACNLDLKLLFQEDLMLINKGALAEQFVGQELLAYAGHDLYFWVREEKSSSAEIDYLISVDGRIVPIKVKSGALGTLRSLHIVLQEHNLPLGVRIADLPLSYANSVLTIPFYLISELPRLVQLFVRPK